MIEIPGYKVEKVLGKGGMSSVFLALQESLQREVALKVMSPELVEDSSFCQRFLKEGVTTAKLNHPNVVTIFDCGHSGDDYYMAMEFVSGGTLTDKIKQGLSVDKTLDIITDVARALHYAHQHETVHRDVKPGNILFREDGTAVLSDFGIAKALDAGTDMTRVGFAVGTPKYMSPEQAMALPIDNRSDLYSLGVLLFRMLAGVFPNQGRENGRSPFAAGQNKLPQLPKEYARFQPVIDKLLAFSPEDRYDNAQQLVDALDALRQNDQSKVAKTGHIGTDQTELTLATGVERVNRLAGKWGVGVSILGALMVGGGAWIMKNTDNLHIATLGSDEVSPLVRPEQPETSTSPDLEQFPVAEEEVLVHTPSNSVFDEKVDQLLTIADAHMMIGRFMQPLGSNAFSAYLKVLELDPGNDAARAGLVEATNEYMKRLPNNPDRLELAQTSQQIGEALEIVPGNADLLQLRDKITRLDGITR